MIRIVVGLPGSGKSYYAAWLILEEMKKSYRHWQRGTQPRYVAVWTNLEGLRGGVFVKKLDLKKLEELWKWEMETYKSADTTPPNDKVVYWWMDKEREKDPEEELVGGEVLKDWEGVSKPPIEVTRERFRKEGHWRALFVIDEAHTYFKVARPWVLRWVSFHRHYDQDLIFIVQDLSQLDRRIVALAMEIIEAVNPLLRIGNKFHYRRYAGNYISYRRTNLVQRFSLPKDPEVFNLYESGGYITPKTIMWKPILIVLFSIGMVIWSWWKLYTRGEEQPKVQKDLRTQIKVEKYIPKFEGKKEKDELIKAKAIGEIVELRGEKIPLNIFLKEFRVIFSEQKGPFTILWCRKRGPNLREKR
jgi:zona occludens toxin